MHKIDKQGQKQIQKKGRTNLMSLNAALIYHQGEESNQIN